MQPVTLCQSPLILVQYLHSKVNLNTHLMQYNMLYIENLGKLCYRYDTVRQNSCVFAHPTHCLRVQPPPLPLQLPPWVARLLSSEEKKVTQVAGINSCFLTGTAPYLNL